jgi:hypothetical protein
MLNGLWLSFFVVAAVAGLSRWLLGDDPTVFAAMVESLFAMAKLSVEVMILLFGTLTLWLGLLRIAEKAGLVAALARLLGPLFARLMPEVPRGHPALGLITMNFAANGLGSSKPPANCRALVPDKFRFPRLTGEIPAGNTTIGSGVTTSGKLCLFGTGSRPAHGGAATRRP